MPFNLLLVDDSVTIRRVVELTFAGEDVNVIAVGDGREAIARAVREPPDIILADVGLGDPDGYQVAAFVKRHAALAQVPVVLLTGAFQPVDRVRAAECGCDGVLAKPFDLQSMVGVVRGLLERGHPQPPAAAQGTPEPAPQAGEASESPAAGGEGEARPKGSTGNGSGDSSADPGSGDAEAASLFEWWVRLLEQPPPDGAGAVTLPAPVPVTAAPLVAASQPPREELSLDEYFDLVDELIDRPAPETSNGPVPRFRAG